MTTPTNAAPLDPETERVVRHPNGHLMIEQFPRYVPSQQEIDKALASLAKAYPYVADNAPHIDGEFDNALTETRRMFARFVELVSRSASPGVGEDTAGVTREGRPDEQASLRAFTCAVAMKIGADVSFSEAMEREGCSTIDLVTVLSLAERGARAGSSDWTVTTLRSALENWGRHFDWCRYWSSKPCDCGLADAIAARSASRPEETICSQCGQSLTAPACGPTHAILAAASRPEEEGQ